MRLIGIDCACSSKDIGLALGEYEAGGRVRVIEARSGRHVHSVPSAVAAWLRDATPCLLAIDAPLGWPAEMGPELAKHTAGQPISTEPNRLFRRDTDRVVHDRLGRTPLDVGADRIARTAHAALTLLQKVRDLTSHAIPLAWGKDDAERHVSAIEVYPAGTLIAHRLPASGYKQPDQGPVRSDMLARLSALMTLPEDPAPMIEDADVLDAVVCLLAAADFLKGECIQPADLVRARREGWIWVSEKASPL